MKSNFLLNALLLIAVAGGVLFLFNKLIKKPKLAGSDTNKKIHSSVPVRFESMPADSKAGKREITVALEIQDTCELGDADAVEMDLAYSQSKKVLLSLEALSQSDSFAAQSYSPSNSELSTGFRHTFSLPEGKSLLGLFLCKDSNQRGKCLGKEAIHPTTLVVKDTEDAKNPSFQAPDRIYLFQQLQVMEKEIDWMPREIWIESGDDEILKSLSSKFGDSASEEKLRTSYQTAKNLHKELGFPSLLSSNSVLYFGMTRHKGEGCK